jgi:hypothetical protein
LKQLIILIVICSLLLVGCQAENITPDNGQMDKFTSWNEEKLYRFFEEVLAYTQKAYRNIYTFNTKEEIVSYFSKYFSSEISERIVNSIFIKTDEGWKAPDGGGGYMFAVPRRSNNIQVEIDFDNEWVRLKATFVTGMYSSIEYVIENYENPMITEWIINGEEDTATVPDIDLTTYETNVNFNIKKILTSFEKAELHLKPQADADYPTLNNVKPDKYEWLDASVFFYEYSDNAALKEGLGQVQHAYPQKGRLHVHEMNNVLIVYVTSVEDHPTDLANQNNAKIHAILRDLSKGHDNLNKEGQTDLKQPPITAQFPEVIHLSYEKMVPEKLNEKGNLSNWKWIKAFHSVRCRGNPFSLICIQTRRNPVISPVFYVSERKPTL